MHKSIYSILFSLLFSTICFAQFEAPVDIETFSFLNSINSKDVDGDGDLDLLLARRDQFYYYENDGSGVFVSPVDIGDMADKINDVEIADLDGDGDLDIAYVAGSFDKSIGWLENDGLGGYTKQDFNIDSDDLGTPGDIELADLDSDGDLDYITTNYDERELRLTYNLGNGQFGNTQLLESPVWMLETEAYDNDGDGVPEIHFVSRTGSQLAGMGYYKRNGAGEYEVNYINVLSLNNSNLMELIDIDLDGDLDVIGAHALSDRINWAENMGDGTFGGGEIIWRKQDFELDSRVTNMHTEIKASGLSLFAWTERGNMYRMDQVSGTTDFAEPVLIFEGPHDFPEDKIKIFSEGDYNEDGAIDIVYINSDTLWIRNGALLVDADGDGFANDIDCDDDNPDVNPNQIEILYNGLNDDCNSATLDDDLDQDGFLFADDCDDNNPNINPDITEEPYNGIDDDCDTATLDDDLDQDGFLLADDCDDTNSEVNPDADEIPDNGLDDDCDGVVDPSSTYELSNAIVSIHPNPAVDVINIDVDGHLSFKINLYDTEGRVIYTASNTSQIRIDEFPRGIYLLELQDVTSGRRIIERIIKGK